MKRAFVVIFAMMVIAVSTIAAKAQVFTSQTDSSMGKIVGQPFALGEVGAIVVDNGKEIKILHAMPAEQRPKAYKDVDVKDGDVILMCNGKRLKALKELEEAYKATAVGAEFKMGVRRNDERLIVAFAKADPKDLPQMQMSISTTDGSQPGGGGMRRFIIGGSGQNAGDIVPLIGLGLIVGKKDNVFKIVGVMPNAAKGADFKIDDMIESFNGEKIKSTQQLSDLYEKLAVGAKIEVHYKRGGKNMQASLTKPEAPQGRVMMRNNQ